MICVSIIMPVYNSEKYVRHAVASIQKQSETSIEIILVDDGSTDRSGEICDELAEHDQRIRVIHQKNQGICAARNTALNLVRGKYITFCDNDDEFLPELIKDNYQIAEKYHADIVRFCRRRIVSVRGKIVRDSVMDKFPFRVIQRQDYGKYDHEISMAGNGVWTGMYRTDFIRQYHIRFDEFMKYGHEDNMFNLKSYQNFNIMVLNPKVYYIWMNRMEHSTTGKFNINYIESMKRCMDQELLLADQYSTINTGSFQSKLVRAYVYPVYDYLNMADNKISLKEKKNILKEFRMHKAFRVSNNRRWIRKDGLFMWVLWEMFYHKIYILPYFAIHVKQKIFNS